MMRNGLWIYSSKGWGLLFRAAGGYPRAPKVLSSRLPCTPVRGCTSSCELSKDLSQESRESHVVPSSCKGGREVVR